MSPRILVVEDDQHFADILLDYLGYLGFEAKHCLDGALGLEAFKEDPPDVLLTDVLLPRLNGLELAAHVKGGKAGPAIPVILMSAVYTDREDIQGRLRQCGADDYLIKPVDLSTLRDALLKQLPADSARAVKEGMDRTDPELSVSSPGITRDDIDAGRIAPGTLPELLLRLRARRHTGTLRLEAGQRRKSIVFLAGHPVWAESSDEHDRLGTMLLEDGAISRDQFTGAIERMRDRGIDFGSALTESGTLSPTELYRHLRRLVRRRVISAFGWVAGGWEVTQDFPKQTPSFEVEPLGVILDGLEAHGDQKALWRELEPRRDRYVVPTSRFRVDWPMLKGREQCGGLGAFLSGKRTLEKLRLMEIIPEDDFVRVMWLLYKAGMVGFGEQPPAEAAVEAPITISIRQDPGAAAAAVADIAERVLADYFRYWQADFFKIYEVDPYADDEDVAEALSKPILSFDAERLPDALPGDLRTKAKALTMWIDQAQRTLSSPAERMAYRERLEEGLTGIYRKVGTPDVDEAAMFFELGRGFLQTNDFREAQAAFHKAVDRVPDSAKYLAYLGYAAYRNATGEPEAVRESLRTIREALRIDPQLATAHYFLGVVHRDRRHYPEACRAFEAALRCDPQLVAAEVALRESRELSGSMPPRVV